MALTYIKISNSINILDIYLQDICLLIKPSNSNNPIIKGNYKIIYELR